MLRGMKGCSLRADQPLGAEGPREPKTDSLTSSFK
jgi:hypothetical protein